MKFTISKFLKIILFVLLLIFFFMVFSAHRKQHSFDNFQSVIYVENDGIVIDKEEYKKYINKNIKYPATNSNTSVTSTAPVLAGGIIIPAVDINMPVYVSNGVDDIYSKMNYGIVFDDRTYLPNEGREIVLMGHRETNLVKLQDLEIGDEIFLYINGSAAKYKVYSQEHIEDTDTEKVYSPSSEEIRLFTCYPFRAYTRVNGRWLVKAKFDKKVNIDYSK